MDKEHFPSPEKKKEISDAEVGNALEASGIEDEKVQELLRAWAAQEEEKVRKENTPEAAIRFQMRRGQLYFNTRYFEEGWNDMNEALYQARQIGNEGLMKEIHAAMDRMDDRLDQEQQ